MVEILGLNIFLQMIYTFLLIYGTLKYDKIKIRLLKEYPITISEINTRVIPKGRYKSKVELIIPLICILLGIIGYFYILLSILFTVEQLEYGYQIEIDSGLFYVVWGVLIIPFNWCIFKFHKQSFKNLNIKSKLIVKEQPELTHGERSLNHIGSGSWNRGSRPGSGFLTVMSLGMIGFVTPFAITFQIFWIMDLVG